MCAICGSQGCAFSSSSSTQKCADFESLNGKGFTKPFMYSRKENKMYRDTPYKGNNGMLLSEFDEHVAAKCCGVAFVPIPADALSHTATVRDVKAPYTYV